MRATTELSAHSARKQSSPTSMSHRSWSARPASCRCPRAPTVAAAFQPAMDALRARGFAKAELINLHVKRLSATTVIAGGVAVRTKTDGQELERAGVVYLLQKANGEG